MAKLTLSLGSNEGAREQLLERAVKRLATALGPVVYRSPVLETPPWGGIPQPAFLNLVVVVATPVPLRGPGIPAELHRILTITQGIETELGRVRTLRWGARTLDIDLIFADDLRYEDARISLPHPWWAHRSFVTDLLPPPPEWKPPYSR